MIAEKLPATMMTRRPCRFGQSSKKIVRPSTDALERRKPRTPESLL
jgi:hypothetical protein